jgi:DNA repair protein RadC
MLKDLPAAMRPREKLLAHGPSVLADVELLALLLRTGLTGTPVLQFAQGLLDRFHGLAGLLNAGLPALESVKGLGPAKRAEMVAVLELARRSLVQQMREQPLFDSPERVKQYLQLQLSERAHEVFGVLFLDSQNRMLSFEELFRGTLTQTSVYPREIVKRALELRAGAVILAHNHPSGVAEPSRADELLTGALKNALSLVDVKVLDHVVVGKGCTVSFAERGLL